MYEKVLKDSAASFKAHATMRGAVQQTFSLMSSGNPVNDSASATFARNEAAKKAKLKTSKKTDAGHINSIAATLGIV